MEITIDNHMVQGPQQGEPVSTIDFSAEGCIYCLKEAMIRLLQTNPKFKQLVKEVVHEANLRRSKAEN
jgi:thiol-disulfide isomerase/thioredoxin